MIEFTDKQKCLDWLVNNYESAPRAIYNHKRDWSYDFGLALTDSDIIEAFENKHTDLDSKQQLEQRVVESFGGITVKDDELLVWGRIDPDYDAVEKPNKYILNLKGVECDVYDVLKAFNVTCPALQHLIKKALCAGLRGHKDKQQDLKDILDSAKRAIELNNVEVE